MAAFAAPAMGQSVPPDNSGANQYAPSAPSATGPRALGGQGARGGGIPLDPSVAAKLRSGKDQLLKALATDRGLGAPPNAEGRNSGSGDPLLDSQALLLLALLAAIGAGGLLLLLRRRSDDQTPAT
jgi:hypothetical protein